MSILLNSQPHYCQISYRKVISSAGLLLNSVHLIVSLAMLTNLPVLSVPILYEPFGICKDVLDIYIGVVLLVG